MTPNAQNSRQAITAAWLRVLREPPNWRFFIDPKDGAPVMFDTTTDLGIAYSQTQKCWALGHITRDDRGTAEFVYVAGPFDTLEEGTAALLGAVAHHRALPSVP